MAPRRVRTNKASEHDIQVSYFEWVDLQARNDLRYLNIFAIPNGAKLPWRRNAKGMRFSPEAIRLLREGLRSGVPDVLCAWPGKDNCGLYLEVKIPGNKVSKAQEDWHVRLLAAGYRVAVVFTLDDAIFITKDHFRGAKNFPLVGYTRLDR